MDDAPDIAQNRIVIRGDLVQPVNFPWDLGEHDFLLVQPHVAQLGNENKPRRKKATARAMSERNRELDP
tara:strand:+ start:281 stop:487 length:207 start_codon:yes stop_codon:yes gene_type:complete